MKLVLKMLKEKCFIVNSLFAFAFFLSLTNSFS